VSKGGGPTSRARSGFDLQRFVADCREALRETTPASAMREVAARAVADPAALLGALGEPRRAGIQSLHHTPDLTILNVIWAPRMTLMPHDHHMWAVIGIYSGREDNIFWRRVAGEERGRIEAAGARALSNGDVVSLGRDIIHSVTNPIPRLTAALHLYGGDFFAQSRSEWDPETLLEQPFDGQKAQRLFEEANARG
jgi:predicted metal-dependent enzyme (double-stranded beta helix superfamily)